MVIKNDNFKEVIMATSSLSKSFVINKKKEASNFVKLFSESNNEKPLKDVAVISLSQERLKELIHAQRK